MRVVLDTNVVISAFAARGLCAEIFEVCLSEHTVILSEYILSEIKEKLAEKIKLPKNIVKNIDAYLRDSAEIVIPANFEKPVCRDRDDDNIIATALSGKVKFIITGDDDLLCLKNYKDIAIITPKDFWLRLREENR
jgi:putative PIN family toxin of toxin-antitoxin system